MEQNPRSHQDLQMLEMLGVSLKAADGRLQHYIRLRCFTNFERVPTGSVWAAVPLRRSCMAKTTLAVILTPSNEETQRCSKSCSAPSAPVWSWTRRIRFCQSTTKELAATVRRGIWSYVWKTVGCWRWQVTARWSLGWPLMLGVREQQHQPVSIFVVRQNFAEHFV